MFSFKKSVLTCALYALTTLLITHVSHAETVPSIFNGVGLEVAYNNHGLWNSTVAAQGLEFSGTPISYPGAPWQQVSIGYNGAVQTLANHSYHQWDVQVPLVGHTGGSGFGNIGSTTVWKVGDLRVIKDEAWYQDGHVMKIDITVTNTCCNDIKDFVFMHALDPDQDQTGFSEFRTFNDVVPSKNFVLSAGLNTGLVAAYGICDEAKQDLGHSAWRSSPYALLVDQNLAYKDDTMHIRHREPLIKAGETKRFTFMFYVSDGLLQTYHDYKGNVKRVCDCEPRVVNIDHQSSSVANTLAIESGEQDYDYLAEKESLVSGIENVDDARSKGLVVGQPEAPANKQRH